MSGGVNAVNINALLQKTEHYDKDERYMATSDLCEALKRHAAASSTPSSTNPTPPASAAPYHHHHHHHHHHHQSYSTSTSSSQQQQQQQSPLIDSATERRICSSILKLLDDSSNDVQAIAVKTLGVLLTTVHEEQVSEIAERLCTLVLDANKSELRDVYAIGLRTLVKTVPIQMGDLVSHCLVGKLILGIRYNSENLMGGNQKDDAKSSEEIILACLDVLTDLLTQFGSTSLSISRRHEEILQITLSQLASDRHVVRKRAGTTIGCLSVVISDSLLVRLIESLLSQIDHSPFFHASTTTTASSSSTPTQGKLADTRALIRTMCTVSGAVGHRLGQEQIDRIVPIFLKFCDPADAKSGDDDDMDGEDDDDMMDGDGDEEKDDDEGVGESLANELRESCFAGFESFILRCPKEVEVHLSRIVHAALAYMRYDPNYSYGDEDEDDEEDEDQDEEEQDEDEDNESEDYDDEYDEEGSLDDDISDDDDDSWKVRRSAIRSLIAVVEMSKHDPSKLWISEYAWRKSGKKTTVAGALVNRFKEREENCRVDVIDCFTRLLSITVGAASRGEVVLGGGSSTGGDNAMETDTPPTDSENAVVIDLQSKFVPAIVKACEKQLSAKKGGERTKSSALALLSTICIAPGGIGGPNQIKSVFQHIRSILKLSSESAGVHSRQISGGARSLNLDVLCLVRIMLACDRHDAGDVKDALLGTLLEELCEAVKEDWYKVIAEALRVLAEVPRLLRSAWKEKSADDREGEKEESDRVALALYNAIEPRLAAHDLDQEIKECALAASASLLSNLHTSLNTEQKRRLLMLLFERLKNETTRIAAIKTLSVVASADSTAGDSDMTDDDNLDLSPILCDAVSELASLLRQQSRGLKQSALEALDTVISCHGSCVGAGMDTTLFDTVLKELGAIISDSDLHISHLSLRASMSVLKACPSSSPSVKTHILPPSLDLSTSQLLQEPALSSLLSILRELVVLSAIDFQSLLTSLWSRLTPAKQQKQQSSKQDKQQLSKQAVSNIAKCIAVITAAATEEERQEVIRDILDTLEGEKSEQEVQLSLLISGDLGRIVDLSQTTDKAVATRLQKVYLDSFESGSSEEVKQAAAYALGRASVGARAVFLPAILEELERGDKKRQYLLLSALRELIHCHDESGDGGDISPTIPLLLPHLTRHCGDREEGVRTMVAECLGSLACLEPGVILPRLEELFKEHGGKDDDDEAKGGEDEEVKKDALVCWTVATSVKFAIANRADPKQLSPFMPTFLLLLNEKDLSVKNTALLMVYSAVHHTPQLVAGMMQEHILPSLYELAQLNLKRVVDLGPFKHTVDDALPLRKASLSIFSTCLEKCPACLDDISAFMPILAKALQDVEDIQLQAHQIVISMCFRHSAPLVAAVESFVEPLEKTINKKKGQKTGTELERANEWVKSALRVMVTLSHVDGIMSCRKFEDFVERTRKNSKFHLFLAAIDEER